MNNKNGGFGSSIFYLTPNPFLQKVLIQLYPPAPFINCISKIDKKIIKDLIFKDGNRILDVGSGISKGPGSWLWRQVPGDCSILRMDICDGINVDIVSDATNPPDTIGNFDSIVLQAVPEHVCDIEKLFYQMKRHLKSPGYIYIEMPFLQGIHADPNDYWRATPQGLRHLIAPLEVISIGVSGGVIGSLIWIFCDLFSNLSNIKYLNYLIRFVLRWSMSPLRYLDIFLRNSKASERLACEFFILAKFK